MLTRRSASPAATSPRSAARFLAAVVVALTMTSLLTGPPAAAAPAAGDPGMDVPNLPVACGGNQYLMPQNRGVCPLKKFDKDWPTVLIWGDSHGWMFTPALRKLTLKRNVNLVAFARGGCPPMEAEDPTKVSHLSCVVSNNDALAYVTKLSKRKPRVQVILSANWVTYRDAWTRADQGQPQPPDQEPYVAKMAALAKDGIPRLMATLGAMKNVRTNVVSSVLRVPAVTAPCPDGEDPYSCDIPRSQAIPNEVDTRNWLVATMEPLKSSARLIDVNDDFCDGLLLWQNCHGMVDGVHTFFDDLHLSATASRKLAPYFAGSIPAS
ncbi:MAG: hypothetical protein JWO11_4336 [Nocardioides sp.]|nr:hypothetical protein [Nocardioides sp.]